MTKDQDWINTPEAAKLMGCSTRTILNYISMKILKSRRYLHRYQVSRAEVVAMAQYEDPLQKAISLVQLAKTYATQAKFPPGKFNELINSLTLEPERTETEEKPARKQSKASPADIDSLMG